MAEMLWGFKSPLSHYFMRYILSITIIIISVAVAGCVQTPDQWFNTFQGLETSCMTPASRQVIRNLDYLGIKNHQPQALAFKKSMLKVLDMQNVEVKPQLEHPDHVVFYSGNRPDYSLALDRRGWSYCVNAAGSTGLFSGLRRISY